MKIFSIMILSLLLSACSSTSDVWKKELQDSSFDAWYPPRSGDGIGTIITFDDKKREIIVKSGASCFKSKPLKYSVGILEKSVNYSADGSVSYQVAEALKSKVDINAMASSNKDKKINLALKSPYRQRYETSDLKQEMASMSRDSECFRALTNKNNLFVFDVLGAEGVSFKVVDNAGASIKFNAALINAGKLDSSIQVKANETDELIVPEPMLVGYKAIRATYFPGLTHDRVEVVEVPLKVN
ncbi:hypothetical protein [Janthinobacterium sp. PSPC1-1]|uniref:hypothetical protein n=1 Tax=Janthinobacterium sp. PSPC1-1 TaxID=2804581 RepID=UPI003CF19D59